MRVTINRSPMVDEQEELFLDVKENFIRIIEEYRKKHWFKVFVYGFTGGENLIDTDKIRAKLWYWKLILLLRALRILLAISPPSKDQAEKMIEVLENLRNKLEVD